MRLDGERAIWVSDDGRWQWDAKAQAWTSRPTGRGHSPAPDEAPPPPDETADDSAPAPDEPVGLDAGLDRMWSPPDERPARGKLRRVWSGKRTSRRTRLVLAGAAAAAAAGAALAVLQPSGDTGTVAPSPAPAHAYTTEAQEGYLQQCRANPAGSDELCGCSLARFQARYSQEDFVALQARFTAKDPTAVQQFTAIAAACLPH